MLAVLAAVAVALSNVSWGAEIGNKYCTVRYWEALKEAERIKEECGDAGFYDCCQVGMS